MNFNSSLKKIVCFLLAVLMLLSTIGCQQETKKKKKKKVIVNKEVIVQVDEENNNNNNNNININDNDGQNNNIVDTPQGGSDKDSKPQKTLPNRPLPNVLTDEGGYVEWQEPIVPEFDYDYAALNITRDYVIVYAFEDWENRKESATLNADGSISDRYITNTGFARNAAYDLQTYFKDELNLKLDVRKDTSVSADAKKILVGDTAFYKTNLDENEFAVKVRGDDLIFEGGHFVMVNKAVKWYETVEVKDGKVAILNGVSDDFKSQVTLNGVTYDYVWGDEFDGKEFNNSDNWIQARFGDGPDFKSVHNDPHFQYIENGRLRLTADRYYDEADPNIGYASSGQINTDTKMQFRHGYIEARVRMPFRRGAFPAIYTMTNRDNADLPNYNFNDGYGQANKAFWTIEFDLMEVFGGGNTTATCVHKWYSSAGIAANEVSNTPVVLTAEKVKEISKRAYDYGYHSWVNDNIKSVFMLSDEDLDKYAYKVGDKYAFDSAILTQDIRDSAGNVIDKNFVYYPDIIEYDDGTRIDIFEYRRKPFLSMGTTGSIYNYSITFPSGTSNEHGNFVWNKPVDVTNINNEYHIYSFLTTTDHCYVYFDGEEFLDFDWIPGFDYIDQDGDGMGDDISLNNNGNGYNLWHFLIFDMMMYTPAFTDIGEDKKVQKGDYPFNYYVDWVRIYQDLDDPSQAVWFPNGEAD